MEELRSRLESEKKSRQDLEKELELQVDKSFLVFLPHTVILFLYISVQIENIIFSFYTRDLHGFTRIYKYVRIHTRIDRYLYFRLFLHTD